MNTGKWKRQPQETTGSYYFNGKFCATSGVVHLLTEEEVMAIYQDILTFVKEKNGVDYLQVYVHETTKQNLFFIDQLNKEMIASGDYKAEYNYCTLLLAEEY